MFLIDTGVLSTPGKRRRNTYVERWILIID